MSGTSVMTWISEFMKVVQVHGQCLVRVYKFAVLLFYPIYYQIQSDSVKTKHLILIV